MERGALPELTGRRVSLSKSTHHSSEAGSSTLQAAMPAPPLAHSPRHTGHRKDAASPPHAPSPCRAAAKAGAREPGTQARLGPPGGLIRLCVLPPGSQATPSGAPSPEQAAGLLGGTRGLQSAQSPPAHCTLHCGMVLTGEEAKDGTNQKRLFICKGAQTGGRLLDTVASTRPPRGPPTSFCPSSCLARGAGTVDSCADRPS